MSVLPGVPCLMRRPCVRGISLLLVALLSAPLAAAEVQLFAWERAPLVQQRKRLAAG